MSTCFSIAVLLFFFFLNKLIKIQSASLFSQLKGHWKWDVLQPASTSQFMSSLLTSSCSDSGIQYLSVSRYACVCVCLNTPVISVLSDWLADGVDLSDSAVCQAG